MFVLKNIANILLAGLILLSTTGVTLQKHYCMNRLLSMSIGQNVKSCCNMEEAMDCCRNESMQWQVDDDFQGQVITSLPEVDFSILYTLSKPWHQSVLMHYQELDARPTRPPPLTEPNTIIAVQSFRC